MNRLKKKPRLKVFLCLFMAYAALMPAFATNQTPAFQHLAPPSSTKDHATRLHYLLCILQKVLDDYAQKNNHLALTQQEDVLTFLRRELGPKTLEWFPQSRLRGDPGMRRLTAMAENVTVELVEVTNARNIHSWVVMPWLSEDPAEDYGPMTVAGTDMTEAWKGIVAAKNIRSLEIRDGVIVYKPRHAGIAGDVPMVDEQMLGPWRKRLNEHRGGRPAALAKLGPHDSKDCRYCTLYADGILQQEIVLDLPVGDGEESSMAIYNATPFAKDGHMIWIPKKNANELDAREQKVTQPDLARLFKKGNAEICKNHMFIVNSRGAASVNHYHEQSLYFPDNIPLSAEISGWGKYYHWKGHRIEFNLNYPAPIIRLDISGKDPAESAKVAMALIDEFDGKGIELSMVLRNNKFYLFPRSQPESRHLPDMKIGALEMMGLIIMTSRNHYMNVNQEHQIQSAIADVGIKRSEMIYAMLSALKKLRGYRSRQLLLRTEARPVVDASL